MEKINMFLEGMEKKLDAVESSLKSKELTLPTQLLGAGLFLALGVVILIFMPQQVPVSQSDVVNGRVFPQILVIIMMICCSLLILNSLWKLYRGEAVEICRFQLLTEVKALVIMGILVLTYLISKWTELFVLGAVFCALSFLLYFRCRKWNYYLITVGLAVIIWCAFRFGLNIRF